MKGDEAIGAGGEPDTTQTPPDEPSRFRVEPAHGRSLPERLGDYRIVGLIGGGGMGTAYLTEQAKPRRRRR